MALSTIDYTGISQLTGPIGSAANIPLTLQVNGGTTVVTADTSGNLYVGTTNQLATGFTNKLNVNGSIVGGSASATSGSVLLQNIYANGSTTNFGTEQSSGGPFIGCYVYPGSPAGTFLSSVNFGNTTSGSYVISSGNHKWYIGSTQNLATIGQTVTMTQALTLNTSGNLVFGTANAGIVFDNTTSGVLTESTLNDYETGTWTPILQNESGVTTGLTYTTQNGTYTKIGNIVILQFDIKLSNKGSPGGTYVLVGNMPFYMASPLQEVGQCNLWFTSLSVAWVSLGLQQNAGGNAMYVFGNKAAATGVTYPTFATDLGNTTEFGGTVIYKTTF